MPYYFDELTFTEVVFHEGFLPLLCGSLISISQKSEETMEMINVLKAKSFSQLKSKYPVNLGFLVTCYWLRWSYAAQKNQWTNLNVRM